MDLSSPQQKRALERKGTGSAEKDKEATGGKTRRRGLMKLREIFKIRLGFVIEEWQISLFALRYAGAS